MAEGGVRGAVDVPILQVAGLGSGRRWSSVCGMWHGGLEAEVTMSDFLDRISRKAQNQETYYALVDNLRMLRARI